MLKKCKECGTIRDTDDTTCQICGGGILEEYIEPASSPENDKKAPDLWMYVSTFLIPFFGILLSCVYVLKDDKKSGKSLIYTVFFSLVMYGLIIFLLINR